MFLMMTSDCVEVVFSSAVPQVAPLGATLSGEATQEDGLCFPDFHYHACSLGTLL